MNATEILDIWQAIRESERSDERHFARDETSSKAEAPRGPHNLQDLFSDMSNRPGPKSATDAALGPALLTLDGR